MRKEAKELLLKSIVKNTIKEYMKISHVTSSNQRAKTLICYTFHKMTKQEGGLGKCDMGAKPHIR